MPSKVIVKNLQKRYDGVEAVRGVTFEVEDGEIFGLIGPNGAGKTTTIECVIGLREPDSGEIEIAGTDRRRHPREAKQKIGAALQTTALQDKITPREALALFGSFYTRPTPPADLIQRFSLDAKADAAFDTLSGGQRQRLALALAFVNNPDLVFLDEPTANLDPQSRRELHDEILGMKRDGHTVVITTHYLAEVDALCDRIAIIDHGRVIAAGTPAEIIARSSATPAVSIETSKPVAPGLFDAVTSIDGLSIADSTIRFRTPHVARSIADVSTRLASSGVEITALHVQKATLEDVFIELTGAS